MSNDPNRIEDKKKKQCFSAKVCRVCGDIIAYTRRTARDWERIEYCSAVCRRTGAAQHRLRAAS